jgi:hypothetical protein
MTEIQGSHLYVKKESHFVKCSPYSPLVQRASCKRELGDVEHNLSISNIKEMQEILNSYHSKKTSYTRCHVVVICDYDSYLITWDIRTTIADFAERSWTSDGESENETFFLFSTFSS